MASPLTIISSKDNYSYNGASPKNNYGTLTYMYLTAYASYDRRAFVAFLLSSLPAGATITSATLSLYYFGFDAGNPTGRQADVFKITRNDWVEIEQNWEEYKTGSDWTTEGGDYVTSSPAGANTTFPASAGAWMDWDIKAIVEDAVTNSLNVNLIVKMNVEGGTDYEPKFYSREYSDNTALRPKLVIEYTEVTFIPSVIMM